MERRRAEGRKVVLLTPTGETLSTLTKLATLTGGTLKGEAEMILRRGVKTALQEAEELAKQMAEVAKAAAPYLPYARFLRNPGASFRVKDRELKAADWQPIAEKLGAFYAHAARIGWARKRADNFLKQAAKQ